MPSRPSWPPPGIVQRAWLELADGRCLVDAVEVSTSVSTNQVFRVTLDDGTTLVTKVSSYGRFRDFYDDHESIRGWTEALSHGPYASFLARAVCKDDKVYVYNEGRHWVVFYVDVVVKDRLPRILSGSQIVDLAEALARFHVQSWEVREQVPGTAKSIESDLADLAHRLSNERWVFEFPLSVVEADFLRGQIDVLSSNLERLEYHQTLKIPVLIDWNTGNFSVIFQSGHFRFFSRWDYDWFRLGSPLLDFYFASRVVSSMGDRSEFSYAPNTLLDPRFCLFLRTYSRVRPLAPEELLLLPELYRFFVLNYVVKDGEHFFRPRICRRLRKKVVKLHLPALDAMDLRMLRRCVS
ncbi:MAG: hypothetical protein MJD61_03090 [Proteobacteria bacterium]|nr:hypothetical protein [Pseudomonadota bacterium]